MRRIFKNYQIICVLMIMLGLCACHMKIGQRGYHISRSCRPMCNTRETCVVYRSGRGAPLTRCIQLDPHRIVLDGSRIYMTNHLVPVTQTRRQERHQLINPIYQTGLQNFNTNTLPLNGIHRTGSTVGRSRVNGEIFSVLQSHAPGISEAINAPIVSEQRQRVPSQLRPHAPLMTEVVNAPIVGEQRQGRQWPNYDEIAIRQTMENAMLGELGLPPDPNSKLVDLHTRGFPARKVDITLSSNFINKGIDAPASDLATTHIPPIVENIDFLISNTSDSTQCISCTDEGCPPEQHCYYHMTCAIKICQFL